MACAAGQGNPDTATSIYDFKVNDIKGNEVIVWVNWIGLDLIGYF